MENNYQIDDERANSNFSIHYDCGTLIAQKDRIEFESLVGAQGKIVIDFTPPRVCPFITECYEKKYEKLFLPSDSEGFDFLFLTVVMFLLIRSLRHLLNFGWNIALRVWLVIVFIFTGEIFLKSWLVFVLRWDDIRKITN